MAHLPYLLAWNTPPVAAFSNIAYAMSRLCGGVLAEIQPDLWTE